MFAVVIVDLSPRSHSEKIGPRERRQKVFTHSSHFARSPLSMVLMVVYGNEYGFCCCCFFYFIDPIGEVCHAFPKLS